jgi:hydrogenase maturation factor
VTPGESDRLISELREAGVDAACIGEVIADQRIIFA